LACSVSIGAGLGGSIGPRAARSQYDVALWSLRATFIVVPPSDGSVVSVKAWVPGL
jgi:hypothetical protein